MPLTDDEIDDIITTEVASSVTVQENQFSDQVERKRSADDTIKMIGFLRGQVNRGANRTRYAAHRKGV
jgi:hypothetical protein